jgi:hypothetical protein
MMAVIGWVLSIIALWVLGILTIQISRDIGESPPLIGRWLIRRSVRGLPEPAQTEIRDRWLGIATTLPDRLPKVGWGLACNWLAPRFGNPADPATAARWLHTIFFIAYLQMVARDFVRLRFASPRELKSRWLLLKMIADQALTVGDPNAPQPLLDLARKLKVLKDTKQRLSALQDVLRNRSGDHPEG